VRHQPLAAARQVEPVDVGSHAGELALIPSQYAPGIIAVEQAGRDRAGTDAADHPRMQLDFTGDLVPETGLPPAAMAATGEHHLVKHLNALAGWPESVTSRENSTRLEPGQRRTDLTTGRKSW